MLRADQLDILAQPLVDLYEEYNLSVIKIIARSLAKIGKINEASAWRLRMILESSAVYDNVLKELQTLTGKSANALRTAMEDAGFTAIAYDDRIYKLAGLNPTPLRLSPLMLQTLTTGFQKTNGAVRNVTMTTAMDARSLFVKAADSAYLQITSGVADYNSAIFQAVSDVSKRGIGIINYATGHRDQLDVAVRRTVLTGVNQTASVLQLNRADELECDLVQTSSHSGARPAHAEWQGKVFSRSGKSKKYPNFSLTGYGTVTGLCGVNCRHSFYPFFEGISEGQPAEYLKDLNSQTVTYKGNEMPLYDATQKQREIERNIRLYKRQAAGLEAAGFDATQARQSVKQYQATMRSFISQTGLSRESARERVLGWKR